MRFLILIALIPACAGLSIQAPSDFTVLPQEISGSEQVSGTVVVRGTSKVMPGAVLTLEPGSVVLFDPVDLDGDGIKDSGLHVEGVLVARGTPEMPVRFTSSAARPEPGDWLEIRVDRSSGTVLEHCIVEYSRYGLHAHFSSGIVTDSIFRNNIDGTRFGRARYYVLNNRFENNIGKGINLRQSPLVVQGNEIFRNRHGIFIFEKGGDAVIRGNTFEGNEMSDIRFGDFFSGEAPLIVENRVSGKDGLRIKGAAGEMGIKGTTGIPPGTVGPRSETLSLDMLWESSFDTFIDAGPVRVSSDRIASVTWGGDLIQQDLRTGRVLVHTKVPDIIDAQPVVWKGSILFQAWDRKIRRVRSVSGEVADEFGWPESPADDHRQSAALLIETDTETSHVVFGLWTGEVLSMDPSDLSLAWRTQLDGPIRGGAVFDGENLWIGTDAGTLYVVTRNGKISEKITFHSPIRARPSYFGVNDLVVVTWDGKLRRLVGSKESWIRKLQGTGTYASPVVIHSPFSGIAAADGSGSVYLYDPGGVLLWRAELGSAVHTLSTADAVLWAGTEDGDLFAIRKNTGRVIVRIKTGGAIHGKPLLVKDTVVFGSRDGKVRAFSVDAKTASWNLN